jgi:hypothetical protein
MSADSPKERDSDLKQSFKMLEEMLREHETNQVDISESRRILDSLVQQDKERLKEKQEPRSDAD